MIGCLSNVVSKRNFSVEIYCKRKGTCFIVQNTTFYLFLCVKILVSFIVAYVAVECSLRSFKIAAKLLLAQSIKPLRCGRSVRARSVKLYSTRGGTSG